MHAVKPASFIYAIQDSLPGNVCRGMVRRFEAGLDSSLTGASAKWSRSGIDQENHRPAGSVSSDEAHTVG
jgi:hypothetical protein